MTRRCSLAGRTKVAGLLAASGRCLCLVLCLALAGCESIDLERAAAEWGRSLCQSFGDCRPGCSGGRSGSSYCR